MQCVYAEISVFQNQGIDELIHNVIENCIVLEKSLIQHSLGAIEKIKSNTSTTPGSDYSVKSTASSVPDVQPLNLKRVKKKQNSGCCGS